MKNFQINDDGVVSPEMLWAAHKAVIRGKIIQQATKLKRERQADIETLEQELHKLSKDHRQNPNPKSWVILELSCLSLNLALTTQAEINLRCVILPPQG